LREAKRRRHAGRAATDDQDVDFEGFTAHVLRQFPVSSFQFPVASAQFQSPVPRPRSTVTGNWQLVTGNYFLNSAISAGTTSNKSPVIP
jgi:hypothetical protein